MAYGNWGGNVFRNGERMRNHEDQTPYRENDLAAGYQQAFERREDHGPHHAVLGEKRVRFCGYKSHPVLFVDGAEVDLAPYSKGEPDGYFAPGEGEIEGYKFRWTMDESPEMVNLTPIEPDGTEWTGFSGYGMGAGWNDEHA